MSNHLWTVTANRKWNSITIGMNVEVVVRNSSAKPSVKEIAAALSEKYDIRDYGSMGLPVDTFDYEE